MLVETFVLRVTPDKMSAFLTIHNRDSRDDPITIEEVNEYLRNSGVISDGHEEAIREIIEEHKWAEEFLVAVGRPPVKGVNGSIEYFFNTSPKAKPREFEDGRLDFHDLQFVQNVSKGEKVALSIPHIEGEPGIDVYGKPIPALKGRPAKLRRGKNAVFQDESRSVLLSDIDGSVKLRGDGAIEISPILHINGDIDVSTGNIDVKGDLIIRNDIKAGFKARATGNIDVGGTIEDAQVIAGGSVVIRGGFLGEGNGLIKAGGDVAVKFVDHQKIEAGGDINVFEEAVNSDLTASGSILINKGKGIFVGGQAKAGKTAEFNIIGNIQSIHTEITVSDVTDLVKKLKGLQSQHKALEGKLDDVSQKMTIYMGKSKFGMAPKEEVAFRKLDKLSGDIERTLNAMNSDIDEAERQLKQIRKSAYIKVSDRIYPGSRLKIAGLVRYLPEEREATTFKAFDFQILGIDEVVEAQE